MRSYWSVKVEMRERQNLIGIPNFYMMPLWYHLTSHIYCPIHTADATQLDRCVASAVFIGLIVTHELAFHLALQWGLFLARRRKVFSPERLPNCYERCSFSCFCYQIFENSLTLCQYVTDRNQTSHRHLWSYYPSLYRIRFLSNS